MLASWKFVQKIVGNVEGDTISWESWWCALIHKNGKFLFLSSSFELDGVRMDGGEGRIRRRKGLWLFSSVQREKEKKMWNEKKKKDSQPLIREKIFHASTYTVSPSPITLSYALKRKEKLYFIAILLDFY
jgi:hypothetical protein